MFTGSLRSNLDPFHEHDDATLWKVLHEVNHIFVCQCHFSGHYQVHLSNALGNFKEGLQVEMREGG